MERYYTTGSIYKYKDNYYIATDWDSCRKTLTLIPWDSSNVTCYATERKTQECGYCCNGIEISYYDYDDEPVCEYPNKKCERCKGTGHVEIMNLDNIKHIDSNVKKFITSRLMKGFE